MAIHLHLDPLRFDEPATVVAGATVTGTLTVVATSPGRMRAIEGVLVVRTLIDGVSESRRYPPVPLAAARRIPAGEVQVPFAWLVPADAPPTFELGDTFCDARLLLRFRTFFGSEFPEPIVIGARPPAHARDGRVEVAADAVTYALPVRQLELGSRAEVEVRRDGAAGATGLDVDAELVGVVTRRGRRPRTRHLAVELIAAREPAPDDGRARSTFFVPHNLPTSFGSDWLTIDWRLRITSNAVTDEAATVAAEIPVGVFGIHARLPLGAPPATWGVPSELAATASATLGRIAHEVGWEVRHEGDPQRTWAVAISHPLAVGHLELELARGPRVATLTGRLHGLELGIGLQASDAPRRGHLSPVPGGVRDDERTIWLHAVDTGHADHADLILRPVLRRRLLGGPLRVSDDEIAVSVPAVPVSAHVLRTLARDLIKVAQAVTRLRVRLGPPASVAVDAAALIRLAGDLGGSAYLPTLTVRGRFGAHHVHTALVAPGALSLTLADVAPPPGTPPTPATTATPAARALTARWPTSLRLVAATSGRVVAELALGAPATLDVAALREALAAAAALLDALGPGAGPYR